MRRFRFGKLEIKNFLSIGEEWCVVDLSAVNSTLVIGKNGAGKTTMLEALTFVLFNKAYRSINKGDLINSYIKKNAVVRLSLNIDNDVYVIERTIKPDDFNVTKNGVKQDDLAGSGNQKRFEMILGIDLEVYKQLIVLGTSGYEEFMSLPTGDRRKLLERILKLDVLTVMDKHNKGIIKNLNIKIEQLEIKIDGLNSQRDQKIKSDARILEMLEQRKVELETMKARFVTITKEVSELTDERDAKNKEIESCVEVEEPVMLSRQVVSKDNREKYNKAVEAIDKKKSDCEKLIRERETKITEIKRDIKTFSSVINMYEKGGACPSCNQQLSEHDDEPTRIREIIQGNEKNIEKYTKEIERVKSGMEALKPYYHKAEKMMEGFNEEINKINDEIDTKNTEAKIQYQKDIHQTNTLKSELSTIESKLNRSVNDLKTTETSINRLKEDIDKNYSVTTSEDDIDQQIEDMMGQKTKLLTEVYQRGLITDLLKDSGIRGELVERYIPLFNRSVQKYLEKMGADYVFTVDSKFNETIYSRGREKFKYGSFSRGEQARIDLAILFSWRDIISNVSGQELTVLFLDEVFDSSADSEGVSSIKSVLRSMKDVNIFTISHREKNYDEFDSVIQVKKVGRFSSYERTFSENNNNLQFM